jgi:hypothetical protein
MEILKDKKILVGGLAVIGGIALVAYLLKPKAPRRNSEGFFGASGKGNSSIKNEFLLPNAFTRKPSLLEPCTLYKKFMLPNGVLSYFKHLSVGNNNFVSGQMITFEEFRNAYNRLPKCKS